MCTFCIMLFFTLVLLQVIGLIALPVWLLFVPLALPLVFLVVCCVFLGLALIFAVLCGAKVTTDKKKHG